MLWSVCDCTIRQTTILAQRETNTQEHVYKKHILVVQKNINDKQ